MWYGNVGWYGNAGWYGNVGWYGHVGWYGNVQSLCTKTTMSIPTIQNTMHGIYILDGMEIGQIQTHCIQDGRVRPPY